MEEQIILLRDFILEAPAPSSEHQRQQARLKSIVDGYRSQIQDLEKQLKQERDTAEWLRGENEKLQTQLKEQADGQGPTQSAD